MKQVILRPDPDHVYPGPYVYGPAVPANIFINGQKVCTPKAGVKIGRPMFPDIQRGGIAIAVGDYINEREAQP